MYTLGSGSTLLDTTIECDWVYSKSPLKTGQKLKFYLKSFIKDEKNSFIVLRHAYAGARDYQLW